MKSTWFSNPKHYEFAKLLEASTLGRATVWDGFVSFLELSYLSLSQGSRRLVGMELGEGERRFEEVKSRVHSYEKMPEAMAVMVSSLEDDRYDFLGSVAAELGLLSKWGGQFFTPRSLCRVTALMVLGDDKPNIFNRLTVCEPACGAGAMVIELSSILRDRGFFPWHYWVDCTDVDTKMFWAAYTPLHARAGLRLQQNHVQTQ